MTDSELKKKLSQFVKLGNELHKEAKRRHGLGGQLFHEADGGVMIMDSDPYDSHAAERLAHVRLVCDIRATWGQGAF